MKNVLKHSKLEIVKLMMIYYAQKIVQTMENVILPMEFALVIQDGQNLIVANKFFQYVLIIAVVMEFVKSEIFAYVTKDLLDKIVELVLQHVLMNMETHA
jgi:Flp pilus assembly protein protease CpaA